MENDRNVTLPLASLLEDMGIYPRHAVDEAHVSKLVKVLEAGVTLPPPVIDNDSKRIVDGWHRVKAYRRVLGLQGVIDVILRTYANGNELLLDAIAMNASHGKPLDKMDYVRCVRMCEDRGIDTHRIAVVLHYSEREVVKLAIRIAEVPPGSPGILPGTKATVVIKRPVQHLAGTTLTKQQAEALPSVPGTSYLLLAHQLRDAVQFELANREDEVLQQALRELRDALIEYFSDAEKQMKEDGE